MIKVKSTLRVWEVQGKEVKVGDITTAPFIEIDSHPHQSGRVVFIIDGKTIALSAKDVITAVQNATNTNLQ